MFPPRTPACCAAFSMGSVTSSATNANATPCGVLRAASAAAATASRCGTTGRVAAGSIGDDPVRPSEETLDAELTPSGPPWRSRHRRERLLPAPLDHPGGVDRRHRL